MKASIISIFLLLSLNSLAGEGFLKCFNYLSIRSQLNEFHTPVKEGRNIKHEIFDICSRVAKPGFVECQKMVDDNYGSNRLYVDACLNADKGIKTCVKVHDKTFEFVSSYYMGENDLDAKIRLCNGDTEINPNLSKVK